MSGYLSRLGTSKRVNAGKRAFTLIEMLTVIIIIGIIAATAMPALKGLTQSNGMTAASRQMLDDIALARQKAINNRTKVYMVFVPPNFWTSANSTVFNNLSAPTHQLSFSNAMRLTLGQFNTYALYAEHAIGDQPGQSNLRYLTRWKTLPDGVIIETNMFSYWMGAGIGGPELLGESPHTFSSRLFEIYSFTNDLTFPFPETETTNAAPQRFVLPYIAFDSQGRLISNLGHDQFIPLVKASVMPFRDGNLQPSVSSPADVVEPTYREANYTNYNLIHIDWLTGRAKVEKPQIQ